MKRSLEWAVEWHVTAPPSVFGDLAVGKPYCLKEFVYETGAAKNELMNVQKEYPKMNVKWMALLRSARAYDCGSCTGPVGKMWRKSLNFGTNSWTRRPNSTRRQLVLAATSCLPGVWALKIRWMTEITYSSVVLARSACGVLWKL